MFSALLISSGRNAKIAGALGAGLWGLYWIPLRALDMVVVTARWSIDIRVHTDHVRFTPRSGPSWWCRRRSVRDPELTFGLV